MATEDICVVPEIDPVRDVNVPVVGVSDREMKQRCSVRFCQQLLSKIICNGTLVLGTLVYWYNGTGYIGIQWTPAIPAILGDEQIGWISEVAGSRGYLINLAT